MPAWSCTCMCVHVSACLCMCMLVCACVCRLCPCVYMLSSDQNPLCCTLNLPHNSGSFGRGSNNGSIRSTFMTRCTLLLLHWRQVRQVRQRRQPLHSSPHTQTHTLANPARASSSSISISICNLQRTINYNKSCQHLPRLPSLSASATSDPENLQMCNNNNNSAFTCSEKNRAERRKAPDRLRKLAIFLCKKYD